MASASDVLPEPLCPMRATLRMSAGAVAVMPSSYQRPRPERSPAPRLSTAFGRRAPPTAPAALALWLAPRKLRPGPHERPPLPRRADPRLRAALRGAALGSRPAHAAAARGRVEHGELGRGALRVRAALDGGVVLGDAAGDRA